LRTVNPPRRRTFRIQDWKQDKGRFLQKEAAFSIDTRERSQPELLRSRILSHPGTAAPDAIARRSCRSVDHSDYRTNASADCGAFAGITSQRAYASANRGTFGNRATDQTGQQQTEKNLCNTIHFSHLPVINGP